MVLAGSYSLPIQQALLLTPQGVEVQPLPSTPSSRTRLLPISMNPSICGYVTREDADDGQVGKSKLLKPFCDSASVARDHRSNKLNLEHFCWWDIFNVSHNPTFSCHFCLLKNSPRNLMWKFLFLMEINKSLTEPFETTMEVCSAKRWKMPTSQKRE